MDKQSTASTTAPEGGGGLDDHDRGGMSGVGEATMDGIQALLAVAAADMNKPADPRRDKAAKVRVAQEALRQPRMM
jgi:hypothetical protein